MFIGCCSCVCVSEIFRSLDLDENTVASFFMTTKLRVSLESITGVDLGNRKLRTNEIAFVDWESVAEDIVPGTVEDILVRFYTYLLEGGDYVLWPHSKAR